MAKSFHTEDDYSYVSNTLRSIATAESQLEVEQRTAFHIVNRFPQFFMSQKELKRCSATLYRLLKVETCRRLLGISKWCISKHLPRDYTRHL
jgi:hypothetical protein